MDYGREHQQNQSTQTPAPVTPPAPVVVTPPAPAPVVADDKVTLDDLFPPVAPVTPPAPVVAQSPVAPVTPPAPDDAAKAKAELAQQLRESEERLGQTITNTVSTIDSKIARNNELTGFFTNPDNEPFRKYQNEIVKVATDPRFVGLSLDRVIPLALGTKATMKLGAELAQKANERANGNRTGGNQNMQRVFQNGGMPDYSKMTDQEFAQRRDAIMRGERPSN